MSARSQWRNSGAGSDSADFRRQGLGRLDGYIHKGDIRFLRGERLDHGGADPRAAAGDEDDPVDERGVAGVSHGKPCHCVTGSAKLTAGRPGRLVARTPDKFEPPCRLFRSRARNLPCLGRRGMADCASARPKADCVGGLHACQSRGSVFRDRGYLRLYRLPRGGRARACAGHHRRSHGHGGEGDCGPRFASPSSRATPHSFTQWRRRSTVRFCRTRSRAPISSSAGGCAMFVRPRLVSARPAPRWAISISSSSSITARW